MKTQLSQSVLPMLLCLTMASPVLARPDHGEKCHKLDATIVDTQVTDGCTSPNDFCAAGTVRGNLGLNGTTFFSVDSAIVGPSTAPGTIAASGILVYTLHRGTLTVRESGLSGFGAFFANFQQVLEGTGDFAGVTGHDWVLGQQVGDHFETQITGELCWP
jgi:hypothetical protein